MSLIGMGLYSFLRKAGTSFFTAGMAGSSFLLLYTGMTGNGIASQRAWIMFAMRMGAEITGREYDALTGLAAAAVWICLRQPLYLTDAGFLLSFGAILGIILIEPVYAGEKAEKEKKEREKKPVFLKGLSASFAVNTVLMGPVLWFYYEIPVYIGHSQSGGNPAPAGCHGSRAFGVGNPPVFRTGRWWMSESLQSNSVDL